MRQMLLQYLNQSLEILSFFLHCTFRFETYTYLIKKRRCKAERNDILLIIR